jgi:hypothetical protein
MRRVSLFFLCSFSVLPLISLPESALKNRHFPDIHSLLFPCVGAFAMFCSVSRPKCEVLSAFCRKISAKIGGLIHAQMLKHLKTWFVKQEIKSQI